MFFAINSYLLSEILLDGGDICVNEIVYCIQFPHDLIHQKNKKSKRINIWKAALYVFNVFRNIIQCLVKEETVGKKLSVHEIKL